MDAISLDFEFVRTYIYTRHHMTMVGTVLKEGKLCSKGCSKTQFTDLRVRCYKTRVSIFFDKIHCDLVGLKPV